MSEKWTDLTDLFKSAHKGMTKGQIIHVPHYNDKHAMNAWPLLDPKLDPDYRTIQPIQIQQLVSLTPEFVSTDPCLSDILRIMDYSMSQMVSFQNNNSLTHCLGVSVFTHVARTIKSPLLAAVIQTVVKSAHTQYEVIRAAGISNSDEFSQLTFQQGTELDWLLDVAPHELQGTLLILVDKLIKYAQILYDILMDISKHHGDAMETVGELSTAHAASLAGKHELVQACDMSSVVRLDEGLPIIEEYVIVLSVISRLRLLRLSYMLHLHLTPPAAPKSVHPIPVVNEVVRQLPNAIIAASGCVSLYNSFIVNLPFTLGLWTSDLSDETSIQTALAAPKPHAAVTTAFNMYREKRSPPTTPFLSQPAPEPSLTQKKMGLDPLLHYAQYASYAYPEHPSIIDDRHAPADLTCPAVIASREIHLSRLLPSPCLGLFPHLHMRSTSSSSKRLMEFPSPAAAYAQYVFSLGKIASLCSGLISVLPQSHVKATAHVLNYHVNPAVKAVSQQPLLVKDSFTSQQRLLPPPASPYLSYISIPQRIEYVLRCFSELSPDILARSHATLLMGNRLDFLGVGKVEAFAENYIIGQVPCMKGYINLPKPQKRYMIGDDDFEKSELLDLINQEDVENQFAGDEEEESTDAGPMAGEPSTTGSAGNDTTSNPSHDDKTSQELQTPAETPDTNKKKGATKPANKGGKQKNVKRGKGGGRAPARKNQSKGQAASTTASRPVVDEPLYAGYPVSNLTFFQLFTLHFSNIFLFYMNNLLTARFRCRRNIMEHLEQVGRNQSDADGVDMQWGTLNTIQPTNFRPTPGANPTHGGNNSIVTYPMLTLSIAKSCEKFFDYFETSFYINSVVHREYFFTTYVLAHILDKYCQVTRVMRHVGVNDGMMSTGPHPAQNPLLSVDLAPALSRLPTSSSQYDLQYTAPVPSQPFTSDKIMVKPTPVWDPAPLVVSTLAVKRKARYTELDVRQFNSSFPVNNHATAMYETPQYDYALAKWTFPSAPVPKLAKDTKKGKGGNSQSGDDQCNQTISLTYPAPAPQHHLLCAYHDLFTAHLHLLVLALRLGVAIPRHSLLATLQLQVAASPETADGISTIDFTSERDREVFTNWISNRFSALYRTAEPGAITCDGFLRDINQIVAMPLKTAFQHISSLTRRGQQSCRQILQMFPYTSSTLADAEVTTIAFEHYKTSVLPTHYSPNGHVLLIPSLFELIPRKAQGALEAFTQLGHVLVYLIGVSNKKQSGGAIAIKIQPMTAVPQLVVQESTARKDSSEPANVPE